MSALKPIFKFIYGPRLFKVYTEGRIEIHYEGNNMERISDKIIITLYFLWTCGLYSSPLLAGIIYKKGLATPDNINYFTKFASGASLLMAFSYFLRGLGRCTNNVYSTFINFLYQAEQDLSSTNKEELCKYEFEFFAWPVEFTASDSGTRKFISHPASSRYFLDYLIAVPCQILSYVIAHTVAVRLMYPGSMAILNLMMAPIVFNGRMDLILRQKGERFKLKTSDNNLLDVMFVDKRSTRYERGKTLVICSEGNAGYYEVGIMATPVSGNYSVLGWNHPGFGGSTGMPYPSQELNAMDCVMQFAIEHLGFKPEQIILFGWSIGGFSTCWAAMNYPNIKGVILDATFDDVVPLAVLRMPSFLEPIVRQTIREHLNLVTAEQLFHYPGPISIIRRTQDEIICTKEGDLTTNRGNFLLVKLLKYRYPKICDNKTLDVLNNWLKVDSTEYDTYPATFEIDDNLCKTTIMSYIEENELSYPMGLGDDMSQNLKNQMIVYLARRYMIDCQSTHCLSLPLRFFHIPTHPGT